jgi:polyferredoxin
MTTSRRSGHFGLRRRVIQLGFLAVFVLLPAFDLFRFDLARSRFYLLGRSFWLEEWTLLWLALMFAMWLVGAASLLLGRVYCGYACPQMVFSEIAHDIDRLTGRLTGKVPGRSRKVLERVVAVALVGVVSILSSIVFLGYFAPLGEVARRMLSLDFSLWLGAVGAITTLLTFADLVWVREGFCRSVCPYGILQGIIEDGRSLHVKLDTATGPCISCRECVRVCPMGIDIRKGSFQIECTRCGACVDACAAILAERDRQGILAFRFASGQGAVDVKRVLVTIGTVGFGVVLMVAALTRREVAFTLSPLYGQEGAESPGQVEASFLLRVANRGSTPVSVAVRLEGLSATASLEGLSDPNVPPDQEQRYMLHVRIAGGAVPPGVTPFSLVVSSGPVTSRFPAAIYSKGPRPT